VARRAASRGVPRGVRVGAARRRRRGRKLAGIARVRPRGRLEPRPVPAGPRAGRRARVV
jgi:hypothetical protein